MANIIISKRNNQLVVELRHDNTVLYTYYCNSNKEAADFIELATDK